MDRDTGELQRNESLEEDRRVQSERREENRRNHPRYTPAGNKAPDRRSGDRRRGDEPVG